MTLLTLSFNTAFSQNHGLVFYGNEEISDQRTSLVLKDINNSEKFSIDFSVKMTISESNFYGYVFRLIDKNDHNIDLIFRGNNFQLILGQQNFDINKESFNELNLAKWNDINLQINTLNSEIVFSINNEVLITSKLSSKFSEQYTLYFGQSHHPGYSYKDVASMTLKDVKLNSAGKLQHHWPLDEISGNLANDIKGKLNGEVINPKWVRSKNLDWALVLDTEFDGQIANSYNPSEKRLHVFSSLNHFIYDFEENTSSTDSYIFEKPSITFGDAGISLGEQNGLLRVNERGVYFFDKAKKKFFPEINEPDSLTVFWHHNTYLFPQDSALATIGGYGMFSYKNNFLKYSLKTKEWQKLAMKGDIPSPRYLAGLGSSKNSSISYYIGGYGSDSGDQLITPKNYYDLFKIDWQRNEISKIFTLPSPKESFVFGNNLIVQEEKGCFFAVIFNQLKHNSDIQLIQGSLENPEYTKIASKVPFQFNDVRSTVNLFYNETEQKLFLALTYYDIDDDKTSLKLFEISVLETVQTTSTSNYKYWVLCILAIAIVFLLRLYKSKKAPKVETVKANIKENLRPLATAQNQRTSIVLFGEFQIMNQNGKDLTRSVSPLIKEIFVYILMHTLRWNKGLSSSKLDEMFWFDKSKASARNNRAVNIRKLKSILEDVDGISIAKNTGNWEVEIDNNKARIDYDIFLKLCLFEPKNTKEEIDLLASIVQRGTLLPNEDYEWLDSFKSEASNKIIDKFLLYAETLTLNKENAMEHIEIANNIFLFDPLDELAMAMKCRAQHILGKYTLAKETFERFASNYQSLFNEKFGKNYQEVLEE